MSEITKIEWCDATFNPWDGCQKVGPDCDHCYAEARNARFAGGTTINWGPGAPRRRTSAANRRKPLHWNAVHGNFLYQHGRLPAACSARHSRTCSTTPLIRYGAPTFSHWSMQTPDLDWLLLTKRIGNVPGILAEIDVAVLQWNVRLGATIVNRTEMLRDAEKLLSVLASVRFWSVEPMLGDLGDIPPELRPDWVICGGESGHGARPMHPSWPHALRDQCPAAGVPFLLKQWGEWLPDNGYTEGTKGGLVYHQAGSIGAHGACRDHWWSGGSFGGQISTMVSKKTAGRELDGRTHDEFPRGGQ